MRRIPWPKSCPFAGEIRTSSLVTMKLSEVSLLKATLREVQGVYLYDGGVGI